MTRIEISAHRIFSLLISFFFFTFVYAEQTAVPTTLIAMEAKSETFVLQHPDQYLSWKATSEQSERVDTLTEDSQLVILWAGYLFPRDYNRPYGYALAVTDACEILRIGTSKDTEDGSLSMVCWSCKSPDVARLIQKDNEDGCFHGEWTRGSPEVANNLDCVDCHSATSPKFTKGKPELTLSRPYAVRVVEAISKPFEKVGRFDQQSMVCGQCHVEYYFDGKSKIVKFSWDDGMKVENMEQYYDRITSPGWISSLSKTPMSKAQHPEYETWTAGIHGKNNVTCIDCHMSRIQNAEGKLYVDHKTDNPSDNSAQICANCRTQGRAALQKVVAERKQLTNDLKIKVEDQLVHAHFEAKTVLDAGTTEAKVKPIQDGIRHAQQRWDSAITSHGIYIHASEKGLRIFGTTINKAADTHTKLACLLATKGIIHKTQIPDILTEEKAQQVIGLDMEQIKAEKQDFIKTVIPQWEERARKNGLLSR